MKTTLFPTLLCSLLLVFAAPTAAARTIEFETTEVTEADVALSPDGDWLIFTMLGHLFRLPVQGGTAEQLTFGPYYDTDPVFSPDGARVAYVSDRDGSEGNVFVLALATGQITQVTQDPWAARPTWTPDGQGIVYIRFSLGGRDYRPRSTTALVRRISVSGGEPETLSTPARLFRSVFYLPDGRLAWTVVEPEADSPHWTTRVEVVAPDGRVSPLRTLGGYVDRVVASRVGDGFYCRRFFPLHTWYPAARAIEELIFVPLSEGSEEHIVPVSAWWWSPRFDVSTDEKALYVGHRGRLWKISLSGKGHLPPGEPLAFKATVKLEVQDPVAPQKFGVAEIGRSMPLRGVIDPRLSPDGRSLVFMAAGYLWQQPLDGGRAQRLFADKGFKSQPAISPDGRRLAFVHSENGEDEIRLFDFESEKIRTLSSGMGYSRPSWSPDGQRLVFLERKNAEDRVVTVNLSKDETEVLPSASPGCWQRPHFSPDGQWLYSSDHCSGRGVFYRLPLKQKGKVQPITELEGYFWGGLASPDGKWLAFWRQMGIWLAPMGQGPIKENDVRQFNPGGGDTFAFTPDSSALIYSAGSRVWLHPLAGGERKEIPIRVEVQRIIPPPLLLRRVRVMDFETGAFSRETSLFLEQGRISWIGSERGRRLPRDSMITDAGGRFAIPGLFDLHTHHRAGFLEGAPFIAYGITSVRDVGSSLQLLNPLADRSDVSSDPLPHYFYSGDLLDQDWMIYSEEDALTYVPRWREWGAQFIKVHPPFSWPLQRAVNAEARRVGLPVVGHGATLEELTKGVILGYWSLEHHNLPGRLYDDVLQMLAAAGTRWDPTLVTTKGAELMLRDHPERLDAKLRAFFPEGCRSVGTGGMRTVGEKVLRGALTEELASVRAAHRRGVKLLAGTDIFGDRCFPAVSLHWELEYFVQAGIPPLEVLRIATQDAAAALGAEGELGSIEPGKLADIVLLDANPLENIRNTQSIWRTIKGGWVFDPEKLRPPQSADAEQ